jgi:hypothetical protein
MQKREASPLAARTLAALIEESPSVKAAMKAGKKTTIRMRIYREKTGKWDDYGPISKSASESWASWLRGKLGTTKVKYRVKGMTVDETMI